MAVKVISSGASESDVLIAALQKKHGESIGGIGAKYRKIRRVKTGIFPLDLSLGGGFPRSRMCVVYGPENSGKTNLALLCCAYVQSHCGVCDLIHKDCKCPNGPAIERAVMIDMEHSYDPHWGRQLGIDNEKLILLQPEYAEQAADIVGDVLHASDVGICVLDSIAAMTTSAMVENSVEKAEVGGSALVMTKFMKKVTVALSHESKRDHLPLLLCVNQIRMKIGVMFGNPESQPGGNAFRFASSMTLRIHGKDKFDKEISQTMPIYKETSAALNRWKVPVTSKTCEYDFCVLPHNGIPAGYVDDWNTVSNFLKGYEVLGKTDSGAWFCLNTDGELEEFKTLTAIRQKYNEDTAFNEYLKSVVVAREMKRYSLHEGDEFDV